MFGEGKQIAKGIPEGGWGESVVYMHVHDIVCVCVCVCVCEIEVVHLVLFLEGTLTS